MTKREKNTYWERHARRTTAIFVLVCLLTLDFLSANLYFLIYGSPWGFRREILNRAPEPGIASPIYHHDLAKNAYFKNLKWGSEIYSVYTNSLGFRDKAVRDVPLKSDHRRILFMGDSFTYGIGCDFPDTFAGLSNEALAEQGIEVLNAGVESYSPTIYWRKTKSLLEDVGLRFDEMIVFIDISDVEDEATRYFLNEKGNVVGYDAERLPPDATNRISQKSLLPPSTAQIVDRVGLLIKNNSILAFYVLFEIRRLWNAAALRLVGIPNGLIGSKTINCRKSLWTIDKNIYEEYGQEGLWKCGFYMDKLNDLLRERGIDLTVAVYPWPDQIFHNDRDSIQVSFWKDWCQKHGARFLDFFPYFLTGRTNSEREALLDRYYVPGDVHWNKNGHRLVAKAFLKFYSKRSIQASSN